MIKYLITLADHLDKKGFSKEAEYIDAILKRAGDVVDLDEYRKQKEDEEIAKDIFDFDEEDLEDIYSDREYSEAEEYSKEDDSDRVMVVVLDDGHTYSMGGEVYFISRQSAKLLEDGEDIEDVVNSDPHHKYLHLGDSREKLLEIINDEIMNNSAYDELSDDHYELSNN